MSGARACALAVLQRVDTDRAWADRALQGELKRAGLDARDRALATQLVFGAVQRLRTLDHLISVLADRPAESLDVEVRAALRLGLFQIAYLDRIPPHAAVSESVELIKRTQPRGAGLVNAVLRRATREARALVAALPQDDPHEAALRHSHPDWIADLWWEALGADGARALMEADNRPAEAVLRANTLKISAAELAERLGVPSHPAPGLPEGLVLDAPFDAHGSSLHAEGLYMPQSRAAMSVAHILGPQPGDRVLDLCAAPGGKTTHVAALMGDDGEVVAVEVDAQRAAGLTRTAVRMGARCVRVKVGDAAAFEAVDGRFDRVLVDPPCSDLGTLAARPDARWRKLATDPARLGAIQGAILRAGADALRPGGVLVYSTCTISPPENEQVIATFLAERPGFALQAPDPDSDLPAWEHPSEPAVRQSLPHRDGTDGFFIARLIRSG